MYILYNRTPMIYGFSPIVPQCSIAFELYMIEPNTLSTLTASIIYFLCLICKKVVFFSLQFILVLPQKSILFKNPTTTLYYQIILGLKSVIDRAHSFVFNWRYQGAMFAINCIPSDLSSHQGRTKV